MLIIPLIKLTFTISYKCIVKKALSSNQTFKLESLQFFRVIRIFESCFSGWSVCLLLYVHLCAFIFSITQINKLKYKNGVTKFGILNWCDTRIVLENFLKDRMYRLLHTQKYSNTLQSIEKNAHWREKLILALAICIFKPLVSLL